nr:lytic transglycosylase [Atlantibacter subterranea]
MLRPAKHFKVDLDTVDLCRIALLNDYLDMCDDNDARVAKWRAQNNG